MIKTHFAKPIMIAWQRIFAIFAATAIMRDSLMAHGLFVIDLFKEW